jgi:16S rRNA (cytidine1402-2'-O)-methyltransferase
VTPGPGRGRVVLVATPIGNLADLAPRAREVLGAADLVCCEDTRRTRALLSAAGLRAGNRLRSLHAHNEGARLPELLAELARGRTVAVVSDAGTPSVSDPGAQLVAAALDAGAEVTVVPGPSAAVAAVVVSGLGTDRFCVEGFLPRKGTARRRRIDQLLDDARTSVVFESPRRLAATLAELADRAPDRPVAVCRELTKVHEEVWRGPLGSAAAEFAAREVRGEVVVVLAGSPASRPTRRVPAGAAGARGLPSDGSDEEVARAVAARASEGLSTREAADRVARELGVSRRRAYEAALAERRRTGRRGGPVGGRARPAAPDPGGAPRG